MVENERYCVDIIVQIASSTALAQPVERSPVVHHNPVCGMDIEERDAAGAVEHRGTRYFFCSQSCIEKFRTDPERYLNAGLASAPPLNANTIEYTCPMDPEVGQLGPGACPKCGMALESATFQRPRARTEYTCPMHPEIVTNEPGLMPIRGMALEPREVTSEEVNPGLDDMKRRLWASAVPTVLEVILTAQPAKPDEYAT